MNVDHLLRSLKSQAANLEFILEEFGSLFVHGILASLRSIYGLICAFFFSVLALIFNQADERLLILGDCQLPKGQLRLHIFVFSRGLCLISRRVLSQAPPLTGLEGS